MPIENPDSGTVVRLYDRIEELERRLAGALWLIEHGEETFGTLWRQATSKDIDDAIAAWPSTPQSESER